jgi:hypothetical protein
VRSRTKQIGIATFTLLLAAQFIPVRARNPAVSPAQSIYATQTVPEAVRSVFENSCSDCHSNSTRWPWYSHVAPVSWMIAYDVHAGRRHFNLSEWGRYTGRQKEEKLELICDQVTNGDMPDSKYAFVHRKVRLTQDQRDAVCAWVESAR